MLAIADRRPKQARLLLARLGALIAQLRMRPDEPFETLRGGRQVRGAEDDLQSYLATVCSEHEELVLLFQHDSQTAVLVEHGRNPIECPRIADLPRGLFRALTEHGVESLAITAAATGEDLALLAGLLSGHAVDLDHAGSRIRLNPLQTALLEQGQQVAEAGEVAAPAREGLRAECERLRSLLTDVVGELVESRQQLEQQVERLTAQLTRVAQERGQQRPAPTAGDACRTLLDRLEADLEPAAVPALGQAAGDPAFYQALIENLDKFDSREMLSRLRRLKRVALVDEEHLLQAARLQQSLLPGRLDGHFPELSLAVCYQPCEEVGGDYYDVRRLPGGRIAVLVVDVAGKGLGAALFAAGLRRMVHEVCATATGAAELLVRLNEQLVAENAQIAAAETGAGKVHVTACCVTLDPRSGEATLASAGHPPLLIARGGAVEPAQTRGNSLGWNRLDFGDRLVTQKLVLDAQTRLLLCSDGVADALGQEGLAVACAGEWFVDQTIERLRAALDAAAPGISPPDDRVALVLASRGL